MTIETADRATKKGMALVYVGVFLVPLLLCTGLAVDLGRGYLVRVTLAKAVDAAALAAARNIAEDVAPAAINIFNANFPAGFLGVTPTQPQINTTIDPKDGSYIIAVASTATLPTTFMRIGGRESLRVAAAATATRRLVDMSFVIDVSGSLSGVFAKVQEAAVGFVKSFNPKTDRIALITFSSGTVVADKMGSARGFDLPKIVSDIESAGAKGATATPEALYQAWDELRAVPPGLQSGLRIVVLFTDGSPNSFPGLFQVMSPSPTGCSSTPWRFTVPGTISTWDYRFVSGNDSTTDTPTDLGLFDTYRADPTSVWPTDWRYYQSPPGNPVEHLTNPCIPILPPQSQHARHRSGGIPTAFDLYDSSLRHQRVLLKDLNGYYPNHVQNANNAARNLTEIIANAIRSDMSGLSQIRIYTLGLGDLLNAPMGSVPETGSSILQRIANDPRSDNHDQNLDQLDGQYFFAGNPDDLKAAFAAVSDQVVRLSQ